EARHRLRKVVGGHHHPHAGERESGRPVDATDASVGDVQGDELDVQRVLMGHIGDVQLCTGDAPEATDSRRRTADALVAHWGATSASGVAARSPSVASTTCAWRA